MDVLTDFEIGKILKSSELIKEYNVEMDRESAYEILQERIAKQEEAKQEEVDFGKLKRSTKTKTSKTRSRKSQTTFEKILKSPVTKSIMVELTRGIMGVLGLKTTRSRSRRR